MLQVEKILKVMVREKDSNKKWFYPPDFMGGDLGILFVGYEASARLSELAKDYPDMIESERKGKYFYRRIKWENKADWIDSLPTNLKRIINEN
jgi:hypothetical protein